MKPTTIAVDVAKSVVEIAVSVKPGRVSERHRLSRTQFARFLGRRQPATVVMEACGTAHHWGRQAATFGHRVLLLPPHAVRPYVPRNKTDRTDAKGLLEALRNEAIHPVPLKSVGQQVISALHRLRSTWLFTRTARLNTIRGILREFGFPIPLGSRQVVPRVRRLLEDPDSGLPDALRPALHAAVAEVRELEGRQRTVELSTVCLISPLSGSKFSLPPRVERELGVGSLKAMS